MEYISVAQFAGKYGISERTARKYCADGKMLLCSNPWTLLRHVFDAILQGVDAQCHQCFIGDEQGDKGAVAVGLSP